MPESVYFFTLHKCASSLFGAYVLKNLTGLEHVDYADQIYAGHDVGELEFRERGCVYGPIRVSTNRKSPVYRTLVGPVTERRFIRDKRAILLVRDPRDILVSSYYSFGFSHGDSAHAKIREQQEVIRGRIQSGEDLDDFVRRSARAIAKAFSRLEMVREACQRSVLLRYEDMVENFDGFLAQLQSCVEIEAKVAEGIRERTRPRDSEDVASHKRSGRVGGFRDKLRAETIEALNAEFAGVLPQFGYRE